ncbi:hypothetical protein PHLGIDRAFT_200681 [Phlebiopsis gigantea 11061_1 CR5-6]|uniref:Uncharacterized protein n=1 Tax=Phlebiopsis gigantea (strain 11061_1 CR5-6) TaxID=745531 RepID=A0A0C3NHP2_PHLG1|nr:hypothetical protein PHLGIDRAFT_200681 [Phlebiopsis gigantea 11061_1 CR5-6]
MSFEIFLDYLCLAIAAYIGSLGFILSDLMVLLATWRATFKHWNATRRLGMPISITTLLLRDGSLYFGTLFSLSILQIVFMTNPIPFITPFVDVMPSIIINRFFLNLRSFDDQSNDPTCGWNERGLSHSVRFRAHAQTDLVGPIGSPLRYGWETGGPTQWDGESREVHGTEISTIGNQTSKAEVPTVERRLPSESDVTC